MKGKAIGHSTGWKKKEPSPEGKRESDRGKVGGGDKGRSGRGGESGLVGAGRDWSRDSQN